MSQPTIEYVGGPWDGKLEAMGCFPLPLEVIVHLEPSVRGHGHLASAHHMEEADPFVPIPEYTGRYRRARTNHQAGEPHDYVWLSED